MIYLEARAVISKGQHFDIPLRETQPCIPNGQHLVALYGHGGAMFAVDVTAPRDYQLVFQESRGGMRDPIQLYWIDEKFIAECRRVMRVR